LLRSAEVEFREKLDESGAFRGVERARRRRVAGAWALSATVLVAAVVVFSQGAGRVGQDPLEVSMTPERLPAPAAPEPLPVPSVNEAPAARIAPHPRPSALPTRATEEERPDEARCERLAASGDSERALACFGTLAQGVGLGAEVASYKAARISAEALRDPRRALRLLDEHAVRFPSGTMRGEVRWLRVKSLERAGRYDEALAESEALLAAPEGRALSSDLHFLRAGIYEARHDCQRTASELVALVGEPGARGDAAEMRRAACFERLGKSSEALAAYEKYLERKAPERADEARAKVEALRP
jgi:tetratricopeptide (TPR) repeat protein